MKSAHLKRIEKIIRQRGSGALFAGLAAALVLVAVLAFRSTAPPAASSDPAAGSEMPEVTRAGLAPAAVEPAEAAVPEPEPEPEPLAPIEAADVRSGLEAGAASGRVPKPSAVRGLYVSAWAAGSSAKRARLLDIADRTEINSFVVDVKDATGFISYPSTVPLVARIGAGNEVRIGNVRGLLAQLREHGVYPIARIVVFKDPLLARARPDLAIQTADGEVWEDHNGHVWVNPFNRTVWDYTIALAREAIALGFSEIQWDYVRFPDVPERYMRSAVFPGREGRSRHEAIREFMLYARERLVDLEAPVTADVFGLTTSVVGDMGIGQSWPHMLDAVDVLLPMVYPSHYQRGVYGIAHPNASPYETVRAALEHGVRRSNGVENAATIRAWLQDFSLGPPRYDAAHVRAQIQAVYDAGLTEWVLWNPGSNYTAAALADASGRAPDLPLPRAPEAEAEDQQEDGLLGRPVGL